MVKLGSHLLFFVYFSRLDNLPTDKVIDRLSYPELLGDLVNFCSIIPSFTSSNLLLFTESFCEVRSAVLSQHRQVCLYGPKGCGKSFICSVLFILLRREKSCLFLSPVSLQYIDYFINFLNLHKSSLGTDNYDKYVELLHNAKTPSEHAKEILGFIKFFLDHDKQRQLYLFIDFGPIYSYENDAIALHLLLDCADLIFKPNVVLIMSVFSGIYTLQNKPNLPKNFQYCVNRLATLIESSWKMLKITGFTDSETNIYINHIFRNQEVIPPIKKLVGTNPLLLSKVQPNEELRLLDLKVTSTMENFLKCNLFLSDSIKSVESFLEHQSWNTCRHFIEMACINEELTDAEYDEYAHTWLFRNQLMIETTSSTGKKKLRFNFPGLGLLLRDRFVNFVRATASGRVEELCKRSHSFVSYYLEYVFSGFFTRTTHPLHVTFEDVSGGRKQSINLNVTLVRKNLDSNLVTGMLYELIGNYPVIDYVGHLEGSDSNQYLVFVQLSVSKFTNHKKLLSEIFWKSSPAGFSNLHEHFLQLTLGDFHILFLYISPIETIEERLIQLLQSDLRGCCMQYAKKSYFCGTLSQASHLYNEMIMLRNLL